MDREAQARITDVAGVYLLAGVSVTRWRPRLDLDVSFLLEEWRDLGGRWKRLNQGRYEFDRDAVLCRTEFASPRRDEQGMLARPLHRRRAGQKTFLVPEAKLPEWDRGDGDRVYLDAGWYVFLKQPLPRAVACECAEGYEGVLEKGRSYWLVEEDAAGARVRIATARGRLRWFPLALFHR